VFDAFIMEGYKVLFRVSLSILDYLEDDLMKIENPNPGTLMSFINESCSLFFDIRTILKNSFKIKRFSKIKINNMKDTFYLENKLKNERRNSITKKNILDIFKNKKRKI
jgi:hypothetical protein